MTQPKPPAPAYSPGLDGIIAGESAICWVDPNAGLRYRGYDVEELADKLTFDSVAYLLLHGELPTPAQLTQFRRDLNSHAEIPKPVLEILRQFPKTERPMDALRTGISALAAFDPDAGKTDSAANLRKSVRLIARMTSLTTADWRISQKQSPVTVPGQPSIAERFFHGLTASAPQPWQTRAMDIILILYAEHEFNASTFAARVTASTLADMYPAVVSALGALEGPLHGGANEEAMKMLNDIGSPEKAEQWVKDRLAKKEKIMGFGHRVYKHGDSRVPVMRKLLADIGARTNQQKLLHICQKLEAVMEKEKGLFANLDLYAAPVLHLLQIPSPLNTPIFACGRITGWCAHITEQQAHNRIIRPRCIYTGPAPQKGTRVNIVSHDYQAG